MDGSMARPFFCVFECEVQVGSGATTAVACDCDGGAGADVTLGTRKVRLFFCRRTKAEK